MLRKPFFSQIADESESRCGAARTVQYGVKTMLDPKASLDIESLTELWDSDSTYIRAIGPQVLELLNDLLMSKQVALEKTEKVKTRSFDRAHEWCLTGREAAEEIRDIARLVAKEEIILPEAIDVEAQPDRDNFFWAEAIAKSGLSPSELTVTLLYTTPLVNDTEPLEIEDIAQALKTEDETVKKIRAEAEEKIQNHLFQQILRGGK